MLNEVKHLGRAAHGPLALFRITANGVGFGLTTCQRAIYGFRLIGQLALFRTETLSEAGWVLRILKISLSKLALFRISRFGFRASRVRLGPGQLGLFVLPGASLRRSCVPARHPRRAGACPELAEGTLTLQTGIRPVQSNIDRSLLEDIAIQCSSINIIPGPPAKSSRIRTHRIQTQRNDSVAPAAESLPGITSYRLGRYMRICPSHTAGHMLQ